MKGEVMDMLKTMNDMIMNLVHGVDDDTLDRYDSFYQTVDIETLNTYEMIAYNELDRLLWMAYSL